MNEEPQYCDQCMDEIKDDSPPDIDCDAGWFIFCCQSCKDDFISQVKAHESNGS